MDRQENEIRQTDKREISDRQTNFSSGEREK